MGTLRLDGSYFMLLLGSFSHSTTQMLIDRFTRLESLFHPFVIKLSHRLCNTPKLSICTRSPRSQFGRRHVRSHHSSFCSDWPVTCEWYGFWEVCHITSVIIGSRSVMLVSIMLQYSTASCLEIARIQPSHTGSYSYHQSLTPRNSFRTTLNFMPAANLMTCPVSISHWLSMEHVTSWYASRWLQLNGVKSEIARFGSRASIHYIANQDPNNNQI